MILCVHFFLIGNMNNTINKINEINKYYLKKIKYKNYQICEIIASFSRHQS